MHTKNTLNICRKSDSAALEKSAGKAVSDYLQDHKSIPVLFLASGGSAFKILNYIDEEMLGENLTVSVLDERIDVNREASNWSQLTQTGFYKKAQKRGVKFLLPDQENWESLIKQWFSLNSEKKVAVTMGVGTDGHTAGVMPFPEDYLKFKALFEDEDKWTAEYHAGGKNPFPQRLSVTLSFLINQVDQAFVYVAGEEKREILEKVLYSPVDLAKYPASVIHLMKNVEIYTDLRG